MVRLLHTADWHLGQTLQGYSREAEHRAALDALVAIAREREVDAVVVAGDVFDGLNPSAEAQRLYFDALRAFRRARPSAAIVVVAGNHDPAGRLEAPRALYEMAGVTVVGLVARREGAIDLDAHLATVRDAAGEPRAAILALPFPRLTDLPAVPADAPGSPVAAGVRALYAEAIAAAKARIGALPLVATGHLHVAGGLESEGAERRVLVGGEHAVPPDVFPPEAAYVALGHLHRPQSVGRASVRYAGALFPLSKSETGYDHGASVVTLDSSGAASVEHLSIPRPTPCLRVPPRGALPLGELDAALAAVAAAPDAPAEARPFVWASVRVEGPAVGLAAEVDAVAERHAVRLVGLQLERPRAPDAEAPAQPLAPRLAERKPVEVFREAFLAAHGSAPARAHEEAFAELERLAEEA